MNVTYHVRTYEIVASIASFKASHKVCECIRTSLRTSLILSYQHDKDITQ